MTDLEHFYLYFTGEKKLQANGLLYEIPCFIAKGEEDAYLNRRVDRKGWYLADASNCFLPDDGIFCYYSDIIRANKQLAIAEEAFWDSQYGFFEFLYDGSSSLSITERIQNLEEFNLQHVHIHPDVYAHENYVYSNLSSLPSLRYSLIHYALKNGYSYAICEHCCKPFFRKDKRTKYCTRFSPLSGYTDKQCRTVADKAVQDLRKRLDSLYNTFRLPDFYDEDKLKEIKALRWRYLCPDCNSLEKLIEELSDTERFPPKGARKSDMIKYR